MKGESIMEFLIAILMMVVFGGVFSLIWKRKYELSVEGFIVGMALGGVFWALALCIAPQVEFFFILVGVVLLIVESYRLTAH